MQVFSNNAATTLAAELSAVATSMTVTASTGFAAITSPQFELITLEAAPATREIVKVTARSGNTWTIARAQEGTTAVLWAAGSKVEARATAGTLAGMVQRNTGKVAIGSGATASGTTSIAIGNQVNATGAASTAIGFFADAKAAAAIAVGDQARAYSAESVCIGAAGGFASRAITLTGFPAVPGDDWSDQNEAWCAGPQAVFATPNMDLAVPPAWAGSTVYSHGKIVLPTAGGSVQYRFWTIFDETTLLHHTPTSPATEPTWPGAGGAVEFDESYDYWWLGIDPTAGYDTEAVPIWLDFWPTGVAFICQEYSATTGTPTVSVGTASNPTLILNAASVGITGAGQVFQFTMPNPCPRIPSGEAIRITLDGAASAGVMAGRFVFTGAFVATRSRA